MRAESAVEPTRSENITMTWRRSARSSGCGLGVLVASTGGALPLASLRRAAIASSSFTRCPSAVTPSRFRCSSVRLGRTVSSISFSRNAASYFPPLERREVVHFLGPPVRANRCRERASRVEVQRRPLEKLSSKRNRRARLVTSSIVYEFSSK